MQSQATTSVPCHKWHCNICSISSASKYSPCDKKEHLVGSFHVVEFLPVQEVGHYQ